MRIALSLAAALLTSSAFAANLNPPAATPAPSAPCTVTSCTGWYGGFDLLGAGSGLNALGSGVFADGGGLGGEAGYQFWNSSYYFSAEAFASYMFQNHSVAGVTAINPGYLFGEFVDLGVPLGTVFGTLPSASGSSFPATLLASTLSPYLKFGALERPWGTAWATGAGFAFDISNKWFAKIEYIYGNYGNVSVNGVTTQQTDNLIKMGLLYKFTP